MSSQLTPDTISRQYPPKRILYKDETWPLEIRPYNTEDLYAVKAAVDSSLPELQRFMNWSHLPSDELTRMDFILKSISDYWSGNEYILGVFHAETQELLMGTGYHLSNRLNPSALEIGYWTSSKQSSKGLATLVTKILLVFGFQHFASTRIEILCHPDNLASLRVIEKCGFLPEGTLRNYLKPATPEMIKGGFTKGEDMYIFSLTPGDIPKLEWYETLLSKVNVQTLLGKTIKQYSSH